MCQNEKTLCLNEGRTDACEYIEKNKYCITCQEWDALCERHGHMCNKMPIECVNNPTPAPQPTNNSSTSNGHKTYVWLTIGLSLLFLGLLVSLGILLKKRRKKSTSIHTSTSVSSGYRGVQTVCPNCNKPVRNGQFRLCTCGATLCNNCFKSHILLSGDESNHRLMNPL
jgi:hypothetical protein